MSLVVFVVNELECALRVKEKNLLLNAAIHAPYFTLIPSVLPYTHTHTRTHTHTLSLSFSCFPLSLSLCLSFPAPRTHTHTHLRHTSSTNVRFANLQGDERTNKKVSAFVAAGNGTDPREWNMVLQQDGEGRCDPITTPQGCSATRVLDRPVVWEWKWED